MENVVANSNLSVFTSDKFGQIRALKNGDGSISINAEDVAIGLGLYQVKNDKVYVKWGRINKYAEEYGFSPQVEKGDFIPESLYYLLCMKANNKLAKEFQKWVAVDVIPSLRTKGEYKVSKNNELSPEIKAIFCIDKRTLDIDKRINGIENTMTIDYSQQEELRCIAVKRVMEALGGKNAPAYKELGKKVFCSIWSDYKRVMNVNSYRNTACIKYEEARKFLNAWTPSRELELMIAGANRN